MLSPVGRLDDLDHAANLRAVVIAGPRNVLGLKRAEHTQPQARLRALLVLGAIIASSCAALWRGTQGAVIDDGCGSAGQTLP
jgi:hypothetical protein